MAVEEHKKNDETAIKRVIEGGVNAVRNKDIGGVMSLYAPEVVSFDIVPPLRYVGADAFRNVWEEVFSSFQGPIGYEIHDLTITVGDDVAFAHSNGEVVMALQAHIFRLLAYPLNGPIFSQSAHVHSRIY